MLKTSSRDRLEFAKQLEKQTRPKYIREEEADVMEITLDPHNKISQKAQIRGLLHYCLEYMHYTTGVFYLEPKDEVGVLTSSSWHMTPQLIGKYEPTSARANFVHCMSDCTTVLYPIPKAALTRLFRYDKTHRRENFTEPDVGTRPARPPPS